MPQTIVDVDPDKLDGLATKAESLVILLGNFDAALNDGVRSLFSRVLAPVAVEAGALILDDARTTGCAPLFAKACVDLDKAPDFAGIVANDRAAADIEPGHEQVHKMPAAWSASPKYIFQFAEKLAPAAAKSKRVAVLLFGGGDEERKALACCARRDWPLVVVDKTGGLAEDIVKARAPETDVTNLHPELREIVETASIYVTDKDAAMDDVRRILLGRIAASPASVTDTIQEAQLRYDEADLTAKENQRIFRRLQFVLIALAVTAALLAILANIYRPGRNDPWWWRRNMLHYSVIVVPIMLSIIAAYNSHFRNGSKWVLLRGSAEALKREIFRYRARTGDYSDEKCALTSREQKLAARVKDITSALEQSDVNKTSLVKPPDAQAQSEVNKTNLVKPAAGDTSRYEPLSSEEYLKERIRNQIDFFQDRTGSLTRKLFWLQLAIYIVGGAGTLLAAVKLDVWVALATALVTALTTKLQTDQVETTLVQYNQSMASLKNLEVWWKALTPWEKDRRTNKDLLVDQTEKVLEAETAGWVQQMQSALDKLTEKEQKQDGK